MWARAAGQGKGQTGHYKTWTMTGCKILAGSTNPYNGKKLVTFQLRYPRIVHAEMMAHKMLNKNSASSRAVPAKVMTERTREDMFVPFLWQKAHRGMQGTEYHTGRLAGHFGTLWKVFGHRACDQAELLQGRGLTKQLSNRLLEPFQYIEVLVTGTEWENFFELRCPKYWYGPEERCFRSKKEYLEHFNACSGTGYGSPGELALSEAGEEGAGLFWAKLNRSGAELHIQAVAEAMWDAYRGSTFRELSPGQWHLPLVTEEEKGQLGGEGAAKVSAARAARGSYGKWEGKGIEEDLELCEKLYKEAHWSPFAHPAVCPDRDTYTYMSDTKFRGTVDGAPVVERGWFSEYHGFMSYRYMKERGL